MLDLKNRQFVFLMHITDLRASITDYEMTSFARFLVLLICTYQREAHIDMLIENMLRHLAWDIKSTRVKTVGDNMNKILLLFFKSFRKKS